MCLNRRFRNRKRTSSRITKKLLSKVKSRIRKLRASRKMRQIRAEISYHLSQNLSIRTSFHFLSHKLILLFKNKVRRMLGIATRTIKRTDKIYVGKLITKYLATLKLSTTDLIYAVNNSKWSLLQAKLIK